MKNDIYKIDAKDQPLGRLAVQAAVLLRGKDKPDFRPNKEPKNEVVVFNTDKIKLTGKKVQQKKYRSHSGYLGGLKEIPAIKLIERDSREVVRRAVFGMLPKNRLRSRIIKRLKLYQKEI